MNIQAALVKEQGVTFAVVAVKAHVLSSSSRDQVVGSFARVWPGVPIVLMAEESQGRVRYYGRGDITRFLSKTPVSALPWRSWTVN